MCARAQEQVSWNQALGAWSSLPNAVRSTLSGRAAAAPRSEDSAGCAGDRRVGRDRCERFTRSSLGARAQPYMAAREVFVGDPDLFDDPVAHFEHGGRGTVRRQVPVVQADRQRAGELELFGGGGDGRAWTNATDRVERVRGRCPHDATSKVLLLGCRKGLQQRRGGIPDPHADRRQAEEVLEVFSAVRAVGVLVVGLFAGHPEPHKPERLASEPARRARAVSLDRGHWSTGSC
jgi:hypothetical protein